MAAATEEVTLIGQAGVSDATWHDAVDSFPDKEIATLLMAIVASTPGTGWPRALTRRPDTD